MGKMSKTKGKVGEREVANLLKGHGIEAARGIQYCGGPDSPDVVHSMQHVHIEVKRVEAFRLYDALDQASRDAHLDDMPVVFHRKSRHPWVVILDADDFIKLVKEAGRVEEIPTE